MDGTDVEHRAEIQRENRTTPIWVGLVVLVAIAALVTGGGSGDEAGSGPGTVPATPTSETLTTTSPGAPAVYGLTRTQRGLLPLSTAVAPMADSPTGVPDEIEVRGEPVVTGDQVAVLDRDQALWVGAPGGSFTFGGCCWHELHPSNEPGHVWGRADVRVELVDLGAPYADRRVTLEVGDEQVLGPATFGVVTRGGDGTVRWHRPDFEPAVLPVPADLRALGAGGERLLLVAPATDGRPARLEVWSSADERTLAVVDLPPGADATGQIAPDGSVVLVPAPGGWEVRDAVTGAVRGSLPKVDRPVWVGGARFAATLDDRLVVSDRGELPLRWPVLAVAEQSP